MTRENGNQFSLWKIWWVQIGILLPCQICGVLLQSSPPASKKKKKQGKENNKSGTPSS